MKTLIGQLVGSVTALVAAACCLGIPVVLSSLGAVGLGFLVQDSYLLPLFVAAVGINLWSLSRSAWRRGRRGPLVLATVAGGVGSIALWLLVTGLYPMTWLIYTSVAALVAASAWDVVARRQVGERAREREQLAHRLGRRGQAVASAHGARVPRTARPARG